MRILLAVIMIMFSLTAVADSTELIERNLNKLTALAANEKLVDNRGEPLTVIRTGVIRGEEGKKARGLHDVVLSLSPGAPFPVLINEQEIKPGNSVTLKLNLSELDHEIRLPVFSMSNANVGVVDYTLVLPKLNVDICPEGFEANPIDCVSFSYEELTYSCPDNFQYVDGTGICKQVSSFNLENGCPANYTRSADGDSCVKTLQTEYSAVCESGAISPSGGECQTASFSTPTVCPAEYTLSQSGSCEKVSASYSASDCPSTYVKKNGQCVKESSYAPPPPSCSFGYTELDGQCVKPSSAAKGCPADYTEVPSGCFYDNTIEKETACSGSHPYGGYSNATGGYLCKDKDVPNIVQPECVNGVNINGICYEVQDESEISKCPYGGSYNESAEKCEKLQVKEIGNYCGYQQNDDETCENKEYAAVSNYCADGSTFNSDSGFCETVNVAELVKECPENFTLNASGTHCEKVEALQVSAQCPENFTRKEGTDICEQRYTEPAQEYCNSPYTLKNGQCENLVQEEVTACPSTHYFNNGACYEIQSANESCPSGYDNNGSGECEKLETAPVVYDCPAGYTESSGQCRKVDTKPFTCQSGYKKHNGQCHQVTAKVEACPTGFSNQNGECVKVSQVNMLCPDGSKPSNYYGTCESSYQDPSGPQCPPYYGYAAWEGNKCHVAPMLPDAGAWGNSSVYFTAKSASSAFYDADGWANELNKAGSPGTKPVMSGDTPESFNKGSGREHFRCPAGQIVVVRGDKRFNRNAAECAYKTLEPEALRCSSGHDNPASNCPSGSSATVSLRCDADSIESGTQCVKSTSNASAKTCQENGYSLSGNQCTKVSTTSMTASCPSNMTLAADENSCEYFDNTPVDYNCPSGTSSLSGADCYQNQPTTSVGTCSSGYSLNSSGECEKLNTEPVNLKCDSNMSLNGSDVCEFYDTVELVMDCPSSYQKSSDNQKVCERTQTEEASYSCPAEYRPDFSIDKCVKETRVPHL